jgi:hypothetical protein
MNTIKKNTEILVEAYEEIGLGINARKSKPYIHVVSPECSAQSKHKASYKTLNSLAT